MSNWFGRSGIAASRRPLHGFLGRWGGVALGAALTVTRLGGMAQAQSAFPPCPPPQSNEYLLLVRGNTETERSRIQDLLPSNSTVMVCHYLSDTVVRAGGFTSLENANAWAQYVTEVEGLQAFVARPATTATPPASTVSPTGSPPPTGSPLSPPGAPPSPGLLSPVAYAPQPLNAGFAVLVDYQYQPEMARSLQTQVGQAVGLAVYRQRPYLLIAYSPNLEGAATTLSVLGGYGISGFIVDSREVVMLTPAIARLE